MLARQLERDVKRVHENATQLVALGLIDRTEVGALRCPCVDINVDMHIAAVARIVGPEEPKVYPTARICVASRCAFAADQRVNGGLPV